MITCEVRLFAFLRKYRSDVPRGRSFSVELDEGTTIALLLDELGIPRDAPRLIFVNGRQRDLGHALQPGDSVDLFPPVAGGSDLMKKGSKEGILNLFLSTNVKDG